MKNEALFIGLAFVVGIFIGAMGMDVYNSKSGRTNTLSNVPNVQQSAPVNHAQIIKMSKELLVKDPKNRNVWVKLGNSYFDTGRHPEAIEAYSKALELDPNDPNVLTDQGIMYRRIGMFDMALENFVKANALDPNHAESVYSSYIVYRQDLNDYAGAIKAAKRYIELRPNDQNSAQLRADIALMTAPPQ